MAKILVTGATGYIGGRLIPRLLDEGEDLRCLVREHVHAEEKSWKDKVEVVEGDVLEPDLLPSYLQRRRNSLLPHSFDGLEQWF